MVKTSFFSRFALYLFHTPRACFFRLRNLFIRGKEMTRKYVRIRLPRVTPTKKKREKSRPDQQSDVKYPETLSEILEPMKDSFRLWREQYNELTYILLILILPILILVFLFLRATFSFIQENLIVSFGVIFLCISLLIIWLVPKWQTISLKNLKPDNTQSKIDLHKERIKLEDDNRKTLAQITGGVFIIIGLLLTYNTYELSRQKQTNERLDSIQNSLIAPSTNLQHKGLTFLELFCEDGSNRRTALKILTEYIRAKSEMLKSDHKNSIVNAQNYPITNDISLNSNIGNNSNKSSGVESNSILDEKPETNINTANKTSNTNTQPSPEFNENDLRKEIIKAGNILLDGKCGDSLIIHQYTVDNTELKLDIRLDLDNSVFSKLDYTKADFHLVGLANANFEEAKLKQANFTNAILTGAIFKGAYLFKADFAGANLTNADLNNTTIIDADFTGANLQGAEFKDTDFQGGVDLSECKGLTVEQLEKAIIDTSTKLPPNFSPKDRNDLLKLSFENEMQKKGSNKNLKKQDIP